MMNKKIMKEKLMIFYTDFWKNVIDTLKLDSEQLNAIVEKNTIFVKDTKAIIKAL
jgi:hypothetical protein